MNYVQNFEFCWKYSIFSRNSWILKVLAHEKSGEIKKKINMLNFHGMKKGYTYLTLLGWTMCKILSVIGNIQFLVEILGF
jgi:hypothetical protein